VNGIFDVFLQPAKSEYVVLFDAFQIHSEYYSGANLSRFAVPTAAKVTSSYDPHGCAFYAKVKVKVKVKVRRENENTESVHMEQESETIFFHHTGFFFGFQAIFCTMCNFLISRRMCVV